MTINGSSPNDMVGLSYYACLASGSLAFCVEDDAYALVFPNVVPVATFRNDPRYSNDKLSLHLRDEDARVHLAEEARAFLRAGHTWVHRVRDMLAVLRNRFNLSAGGRTEPP